MSSRSTILWFAGAGCIAMLVLAAGGVYVIRQQAASEAVRDARMVTRAIARGVIRPQLDDALLSSDPTSIDRLDQAVRQNVLSNDIVRVKLWSEDGRVLYSDEPRAMGRRFVVDNDLRSAVTRWETIASVSDLDRPENEFERPFGKLLEVYEPLRTPEGTPVVLELYERYDSVAANQFHVFVLFVPVLVGALALLEAFQIPLAWSLTARLRSGQRARERLLERAVQAQDAERRRIAREVHDGVVQDMIGLSFLLASSAETAHEDPAEAPALLHDAATRVRGAIRGLRGFLVDIYPPSLDQAGLAAAISDLVEPLRARGAEVELEFAGLDELSGTQELLVYRAAQEAIRNVIRHSEARRVQVAVTERQGRVRLSVRDDGLGFEAASASEEPGHLGLAILRDLAAESGGELNVESTPGRGTNLMLELPTA